MKLFLLENSKWHLKRFRGIYKVLIFRWKYYQNFGWDFREEYDFDSEIENLLDKPLESLIKRKESNLSTNKENSFKRTNSSIKGTKEKSQSPRENIKKSIRNRRFSKETINLISKINSYN